MISLTGTTWRAAMIGRVTARWVGTLIALFFVALVAGEGLPPVFRLSLRENLIFIGVTALFAGLVLAWRWEGLGALVTLTGYGVLLLVLAEHRPVNSVLTVAAGLGVLHLLCWLRIRRGAPAGRLKWSAPRAILTGVAMAMGAFLLLCANEILGNPPLMTPAIHPNGELQGNWRTLLKTTSGQKLPEEIDVELIVQPDASVSGHIGNATVIDGQILNNRSWFGKWMNWRADYALEGRLSTSVTVVNQVTDDRFRAALMERDGQLSGSLFLARRPFGLALEKQ